MSDHHAGNQTHQGPAASLTSRLHSVITVSSQSRNQMKAPYRPKSQGTRVFQLLTEEETMGWDEQAVCWPIKKQADYCRCHWMSAVDVVNTANHRQHCSRTPDHACTRLKHYRFFTISVWLDTTVTSQSRILYWHSWKL